MTLKSMLKAILIMFRSQLQTLNQTGNYQLQELQTLLNISVTWGLSRSVLKLRVTQTHVHWLNLIKKEIHTLQVKIKIGE